MKRFALLLLTLSAMSQIAFADICLPSIDDISVEVTAREYSEGGGYVIVASEVLGYGQYLEIFNRTRIYFSDYNSADMCSINCKNGYPTRFSANFTAVVKQSEELSVVALGRLGALEESEKVASEGRAFTIVADKHTSTMGCYEHEGDFCPDDTPAKTCSRVRPFVCKKNSDGKFALKYDPETCGLPDWHIYASTCLASDTYLYCDSGQLRKKECIGGSWYDLLSEDCSAKVMICAENDPPGCVAYKISDDDTCLDNSTKGSCTMNPPWYCNDLAVLEENPKICGCPPDAEYDAATLSCIYTCYDGTAQGECSGTKYCNDRGVLVFNSIACGCPPGYAASGDTCIEEAEEAEEVNATAVASNETDVEDITEEASAPIQPTVVEPTTEETAEAEPAEEERGFAGNPVYLVITGFLVIIAAFMYMRTRQIGY